jgi:hypothetical protein
MGVRRLPQWSTTEYAVDPLESDILPFDGRARRGHQLASVFLVAFAAVAIAAYLPQVIAWLSARSWPTTSGTIVSRSVAPELVYVRVGRWSNSDVTESRIRVRFAYNVAGVPYVGARIGGVRPYVAASESERARFADGKCGDGALQGV